MAEIKPIKALSNITAQQSTMIMQSIARNVAGVITVVGVLVLLYQQIEIPTYGWIFLFIVEAGLYGAESVLQVLQFKNGGK